MTALSIEKVAGGQLRQLNANLEPGLHVLLTLDAVGVDELIPLLDGSTAPRRGRVLLGNRCPYGDPELRRNIGSVWATESLPQARSVRESLGTLGLDGDLRSALELHLVEWKLAHVLEQSPTKLDAVTIRTIALALALSKPNLELLLLAEPFLGASRDCNGWVLKELTRHAMNIPVLVVTASRATALRLAGPSAELGAGFWRSLPPAPSTVVTLRICGASLRPLAAEIMRRPTVQSLRMTTLPDGHDELWLATSAPSSVYLDIVEATLRLGLHLWSLETLAGVG